MAVWQFVLCAALLELPAIEVDTLKGVRHQGRLAELTGEAARVQDGETETSVPLADVLELRFPRPAMPVEPVANGAAQVRLHDGSRIVCTKFTVKENQARLETPSYGGLTIPVAAISDVRFGPPSAKLDEAWSSFLQRESKKDFLVIRKKDEDVLDHLDGVIGDLDEKARFLLDGDEISVNRERIYGLIYFRRPPAARKATCQIQTTGNDLLQAAQVLWDGNVFRVKLASGPEIAVPIEKLQSLDFSSGKVRYLSQMEPREVKYVPFFDIVWQYRRDRNLDGGPLRLGGKTYTRGLAIHSRTQLKYRLAGEYTRFQAMMGIDQGVEINGDVHVVISGDGKVLHEADVRLRSPDGRQTYPPTPLDLNITGVRDLDILVDFGGNADIADHLDLADAKVTK